MGNTGRKNRSRASARDQNIRIRPQLRHIQRQIEVKELVKNMLIEMGEDPAREGLANTPERVERSMKYLTSGYWVNIDELVNDAVFTESYNEMVIVKDIEMFSLCEHHLLPFFGRCHVAYLPQGKIIGLSKIPRIVDAFSRRLQVQERLTTQIAECLNKILEPTGVAVVIEALHLCMSMRGVEKQNSYATTSSMLGSFKTDAITRSEFLSLIQNPSNMRV
ncbi:MAG: GTP cyclohydrolase I FolE [Nitrospinae bacterium]|nr:GTP cyclohydrolase I FolE [Nitrospinota bacterium]